MKRLRAALVRTRLLGRDAVVTVSLAVSGLIALLPVFGWSGERTSLVAAALVALGGVVSAWLVSVDRALPLLLGFGKAVVAAVAGFGVHLSDDRVSAVMAVLTLIAGLATRTQVGAEQPARDHSGNALGGVGWPRPIWPTTKTALPDRVDGWPEPHLVERDDPDPRAFGVPAAPPLPDRPSDDPPTEVHRTVEMTDYVPNSGTNQVQQHRPGERSGRHHVNPDLARRIRLGPEYGR